MSSGYSDQRRPTGVVPGSARVAPQADEARRRYWQTNLKVIAVLMLVWFVVTFVVAYFARNLAFEFFGWPFSWWVSAQGGLIVYLAIIGYYARRMDRLDAEHGSAEEE